MKSTREKWADRWKGRTVVCIASGPSLTAEDCERVHQVGHPTIVTNTTFRRCLWADVLFAFDGSWLKAKDEETKRGGFANYAAEAKARFSGEVVTCAPSGPALGVETMHRQFWFETFGNSGASAISLAVIGGASRIVLLGYDCQRTGGRTHWHQDHPAGLGNAHSLAVWPKHFKRIAAKAGGRVVNCSRATALTCFPRMDLETAL